MTQSPSTPVDPRHGRAIHLRLSGLSIPQIAESLSVAEVTIYRWFRRPEVAAAFATEKYELRKRVRDDIQTLGEACLESIRDGIRENYWLALRVAEAIGILEPANPTIPTNLLPAELAALPPEEKNES